MSWTREIKELLVLVKQANYNARHTDSKVFRDYMNECCIKWLTLTTELITLDVLDYSYEYRIKNMLL